VTYVLHHVVVLMLAVGAGAWLLRTSWTYRAPHTGVVLWQATVAGGISAVIGTAFAIGLIPYQRGVAAGLVLVVGDLASGRPTGLNLAHLVALVVGVLITGFVVVRLAWHAFRATRARRRHRDLLRLVAHPSATAPGHDHVVLDHSAAAAYCVPGVRPIVVVTRGAYDLLTTDELDAVLAHEAAHASQRHDLALAPFDALPNRGVLGRARSEVAALVEMCADDIALRRHHVAVLRSALHRMARSGHASPASTLGATTGIERRLARLTEPNRRTSRLAKCLALALALTGATTPLSLFLFPL
jgi:Zn-dependent protease with chaperone function